MARVFVSAHLHGDAVDRLRKVHEVTVGQGLGDGDAWVTFVTDRVDAERLASAPRLKIVANVAVGVDNIDLDACRARAVIVSNTPGVLTEATADIAFGLLLAACRRIAEGDRLIRANAWTGWTPSLLVGAPVHGATLGIVGFGRIGQAVARRARGFGMPVLYTQRSRLAPDLERSLGATYAELDDLLARSDLVSLHCPLTPETRGLLSAQRLSRMKPGSVLVNTSRGPVVDENALAGALEKGPLAAAGLDVYEDEPRVNPRLQERQNVVLTPHIASADRPTREAMARMAVDNVLAVLEGKAPPNPVNLAAPSATASRLPARPAT
jgi:glyoxylate reductase